MSWTVVSPRGDPSLEGKNGSDVRTHTDTRTQHPANNPAPFLLRLKTLSSVRDDCASCNYTVIIFFFLSQFLLNNLLCLLDNESSGCANLLFWQFPPKTCIKLKKKIGSGSGKGGGEGRWPWSWFTNEYIHVFLSRFREFLIRRQIYAEPFSGISFTEIGTSMCQLMYSKFIFWSQLIDYTSV